MATVIEVNSNVIDGVVGIALEIRMKEWSHCSLGYFEW